MGQYRIRKAKPGETPGYYTKQQLAMRKFVSGGTNDEMDLSSLVPQLAGEFTNAILRNPDPENVDIRPMMSKKSQELIRSGVDPSAVEAVVNASGKQALQTVANMIAEQEEDTASDEIPVVENITDTGEEGESTNDYGYYDNSAASDYGDDDEMINEMLMQSNATQDAEQPEAQMGMQVGDYYQSSIPENDFIYGDREEFEAFNHFMKYGGANGKRKFVRERMRELSKAADGMEQKNSGVALRGTAQDPQGFGLTSKDTFVPAVKQKAQEEVNRKTAQQEYEAMMNQEFQFGGANRRLRRANRAMFGTPYAPPGVNANYDFGFFGGLRSADVSWDPRMMQGLFGMQSVMPGMMQSYSGGWYSPTYKIKGTRVKSASETPSAIVAKTENKDALDKVSKDTPNSTATSSETVQGQVNADAAKNTGIDANNPTSGSTPGTANSELNQGTAGNGTSNNQKKDVVQPKKKKDAWGRSEGDEWFGFDPNKAKAEKGKFKKDKWGRPEYDQWYGFDKSSGKYTLGDKAGKTPKQVMEDWKKTNQGQMQKQMVKSQPWMYNPDGTMKPQAAYADDELIQDVVLGVPGIKDALTFGARMVGNVGSRGFGNNKALPNSQRQLGNNQRQLPGGSKQLGPGSSQKQLGPGSSGSNSGSSNNLPGRPDWQRIRKIEDNKDAINDALLGFAGDIGENAMANFDLAHINKESKLWQILEKAKEKEKKKKKKQVGGAVNPELYKYIYGGDDIDQADIDFYNSKDVSDPYFQDGGLYEFDGTEDSEVKPGQNVGLTKEDVQKMFEDYAKKQNPQQGQQQYYNQQQVYPGSFGSAGVGQPMWGRPSYASGYSGPMGQFGNLFGAIRNDFNWYSPYSRQGSGKMAVDPNMAFAASMANIQKSGMVPTGVTYGKQRKQDGNWFERNLGFNKDRVTTINYAKPGQQGGNDLDNNGIPDTIQSNPLDPNLVKRQGQPSSVGQPNTNPNQPQGSSIYSNTEGLSNRAQRQIRRGERRTAREVGRGEDMMNDNQSSISPELMQKAMDSGAIKTGCFGPNCNQSSSNQPQTGAFPQGDPRGDYMKSQLTVPNRPSVPEPMPAGFPLNTSGPVNTEMAYGGYLPEFAFQDGGYMPEFQIAGEINNQTNPMANSMPSWISDPVGTAVKDSKEQMMANCSEEDKKNPASPCYEKDTEELSFKQEKAKTFDPRALATGLKSGLSAFVDIDQQLEGFKNNYVPGMQNAIYANQPSRQRIETGPWEENTGTFNKMGFEGIVKKGGSTGFKENGEYQLTMDQIREILKAGGKVEFI